MGSFGEEFTALLPEWSQSSRRVGRQDLGALPRWGPAMLDPYEEGRTSTARRTRSVRAAMKWGESPTAGIMR
jgi:hypothetical protein